MPMLVQLNTSQFPKEFVEKYVGESDIYDSSTVEQIPFAQSLILNPKHKEEGNVIQMFFCDRDKCKGRYDNRLPFHPTNPVFFRHIVDDVCRLF